MHPSLKENGISSVADVLYGFSGGEQAGRNELRATAAEARPTSEEREPQAKRRKSGAGGHGQKEQTRAATLR